MKKKLIFALLILILVVSSVGAQTITITLLGASAVETPVEEPVTPLTPWEKLQNFFTMIYDYFTQLFYSSNFAF